MLKPLDTQNRPMTVYVTIKSPGRNKFRVWIEDYQRPNSKYADRVIEVTGERTIYMSLPVTTKAMVIGCKRQDGGNTGFEWNYEIKHLKHYNVWLDNDTINFLSLAIPFSQVCGFSPASQNGKIFNSKDGDFKIKYVPIIRDPDGKIHNTPARIGHVSGEIEVAKVKFDKYTIPMRMIILLHEFSHKYKNPKIGLPIDHESGADINALYIYLGLGFSKVDAIFVFANVFLRAQTPENMRRMRKIMDYIQRFENENTAING